MNPFRRLVGAYYRWRNKARPAFDLVAVRDRSVPSLTINMGLLSSFGKTNADRFRGHGPGTLLVEQVREEKGGVLRVQFSRRRHGWNVLVEDDGSFCVLSGSRAIYPEIPFLDQYFADWHRVRPGGPYEPA